MRKLIRYILCFPNFVYNYIVLKYRKVSYGKGLKIDGRIHVVANSRNGIIIGNNVKINSCRSSNPIGGDIKTILFAKGNAKIRIGDNCGISNATIFACDNITIGNDVYVGGSVKIYDTDFHWVDYDKRITQEGGTTKPVKIEDGAFIGAHSIVLKGVTIGKKSVVGAGSVVTRDIPENEIWAGNPAEFIRKIDVQE